MTVQIQGLRQISQRVEDLDRAVAFYEGVLGLRLIAHLGSLAFFDLGGVRLYLQAPGPETETEGVGASVLYLGVADIHAAHAALTDKGIAFEQPPHVIFRDDAGTFGPAGEEEWLADFRDSEGNILALSSRERPA